MECWEISVLHELDIPGPQPLESCPLAVFLMWHRTIHAIGQRWKQVKAATEKTTRLDTNLHTVMYLHTVNQLLDLQSTLYFTNHIKRLYQPFLFFQKRLYSIWYIPHTLVSFINVVMYYMVVFPINLRNI